MRSAKDSDVCLIFEGASLTDAMGHTWNWDAFFLLGLGVSLVDIDEEEFKLAPTESSRWSLLESSKNVANAPSLD